MTGPDRVILARYHFRHACSRMSCAQVKMILKLGGVVILTFAVCWLPYIKSLGSAKEVLDRLAPVRRGLFEDYVANFWCVSSLLLKWRRLFSQQVNPPLLLSSKVSGLLLWHIRHSTSHRQRKTSVVSPRLDA